MRSLTPWSRLTLRQMDRPLNRFFEPDNVSKGEKMQETEEKSETCHRLERAWGAFARSVMLPAAVDTANVTATFKDGVLAVTLPKTPAAKGTAITVKAA